MKRPLVTLLLCGLSLAAQADPGRVIRATELKAKPLSDAATVMPLAEQAAVEVLERQGGWYKVKANGKTGWVRMTALRLGDGSGSGKKSDSGLGSALQFLSTGRSGQSGVTVATGVRGLDSADMTNAVPDPKAVEHLDKMAIDADEARRFAKEGKLHSQQIAYLPDPQQKPAAEQKKKGSDFPFGGEGF